jgi:hypothetical protein
MPIPAVIRAWRCGPMRRLIRGYARVIRGWGRARTLARTRGGGCAPILARTRGWGCVPILAAIHGRHSGPMRRPIPARDRVIPTVTGNGGCMPTPVVIRG